MENEKKLLERFLLREEIAEFFYLEADLLDERRYDEWLEILADDYQYSVPLRMNVEYEAASEKGESKPGSEICWFDEPKEIVRLRVAQLATGLHWAEEPVSRVTHVVSNVRLSKVVLPEVETTCRFIVYRNRVADETDFLVGRRFDTVRKTDDGWEVVARKLLLDQSVLLAKNLSIFI